MKAFMIRMFWRLLSIDTVEAQRSFKVRVWSGTIVAIISGVILAMIL
jgi:hypothetical protein